jgi:hypothetical protein
MKQETKIIKEYLKKIGAKKIRVRYARFHTECDMLQNIIYFNKNDFQDKNFNKIIKSYYNSIGQNDIKISMTSYAVLHELGHILSKMEIKNLNKTLKNYIKGQKKLPKLASDKVRFYKYRNLKLEKLADKYAYIVYKKFEKEAIEFDKKLKKTNEKLR